MKPIKEIKTEKAPKAIGPYSQATLAGNYMFVSGQIGLDPTTNKLIHGGIKEQTKRVIENIKGILEKEGLNLSDVIKSEVYLKDLEEFKEMNDEYSSNFLDKIRPARQTVQVARLPLDAKVEISIIAYVGDKNE